MNIVEISWIGRSVNSLSVRNSTNLVLADLKTLHQTKFVLWKTKNSFGSIGPSWYSFGQCKFRFSLTSLNLDGLVSLMTWNNLWHYFWYHIIILFLNKVILFGISFGITKKEMMIIVEEWSIHWIYWNQMHKTKY